MDRAFGAASGREDRPDSLVDLMMATINARASRGGPPPRPPAASAAAAAAAADAKEVADAEVRAVIEASRKSTPKPKPKPKHKPKAKRPPVVPQLDVAADPPRKEEEVKVEEDVASEVRSPVGEDRVDLLASGEAISPPRDSRSFEGLSPVPSADTTSTPSMSRMETTSTVSLESLVDGCMEILKKIRESEKESALARLSTHAMETFYGVLRAMDLAERRKGVDRGERVFVIGVRSTGPIAAAAAIAGCRFLAVRGGDEDGFRPVAEQIARSIQEATDAIAAQLASDKRASPPQLEHRVVTPSLTPVPSSKGSPPAASREPFRIVMHSLANKEFVALKEENPEAATRLKEFAAEVALALPLGRGVEAYKNKSIKGVSNLWELRYGTYRFYYTVKDRQLVLLLLGSHHGDRQQRDIESAQLRMST